MSDTPGCDTCGVIRTTTRLTFPVVLVFAGEHIVNASTAPGEGFSGGLLTALSILLLYVGLGYERVARDVPVYGRWGMIAGIALALTTGFIGVFTRNRFLASLGPHVDIAGETIDVTTHGLFDLAIFFVVSSGALAIFRAIGLREEVS
jgi:multisubunit Na+/H+ antiporter MnhB subunit